MKRDLQIATNLFLLHNLLYRVGIFNLLSIDPIDLVSRAQSGFSGWGIEDHFSHYNTLTASDRQITVGIVINLLLKIGGQCHHLNAQIGMFDGAVGNQLVGDRLGSINGNCKADDSSRQFERAAKTGRSLDR